MKTLLRLLSIGTFLMLTSSAYGAAVSHTIDFNGVLAGNSPTGEVFTFAESFVDPTTSTTVDFDVVITLDWIDSSGATVAGLTGTVFGNGNAIGANTQSGISIADTGSVEAVTTASGTAYERLTFTLENLTPGVVFSGYSNPTGNIDDETLSGATAFSIAPGMSGFRVNSIDAAFELASPDPGPDPQAVPEPGTWMTFCLIGALLIRRLRQKN